MSLTKEEHQQRHIELHDNFDELFADWIACTHLSGYTNQPILALMVWSHQQTIEPDHDDEGEH